MIENVIFASLGLFVGAAIALIIADRHITKVKAEMQHELGRTVQNLLSDREKNFVPRLKRQDNGRFLPR